MNNNLEQDDQIQDSSFHKSYVRINRGLLGEEFATTYSPKDRSHRTYDAKRHINRHRLSARISGIFTEAGLWVTGSTLFTSVFGRFLLNKALQDWRVGILLFFVLIIFPTFLFLYTSSKVADMKWAFGLKFLSVTFGAIIGGANA
jgi:hypothetical protein